MTYPRSARVGDQIKREVSQILQEELRDPGLGFITVTAVEVSPDLRQARIFYSVLGSPEQKKSTGLALKRAARFVQQEVGKFAQSFIDFPPMQTPASFNLEGVKEQIMKAIAAQQGR